MGKIISNGIEYSGLTNINGVFIDTNNVIVPATVVAGSTTATYIATEDSYAYITLSIHTQKQCQVYINDEEVAWVYTDGSYNLQSSFLPLKKGQTLKIVNGDNRTDNCRYTIYGVQQGSTSQCSSCGIDYSTTEQKTEQKWIDGSILYKQTFVLESQIQISGSDWNSTGISLSANVIAKAEVLDQNNNYQGASPCAIINGVINLYPTYSYPCKIITVWFTKPTE